MGTSKSGTGPGPGVPLVPPWVPDPIPPADEDDSDTANPKGQDQQSQPNTEAQLAPALQSEPLAPAGRFGPARTSLGSFARMGSSDDMRRAVRHYVRKGYGGADSATKRMGGTARTAGTLYGVLSASAAGRAAASGSPFDPAILAGRTASQVMDALVEAVRPTDGTQDAEASRSAVRNAMSELLNRFPNADLLDLTEEQRLFAVQGFIALDVYTRFELDLGKTVQERAPSATAALSRLKEVKDYVRETVSASFRALAKTGERLGARRVSELTRQTLRAAFEVFGGYIQ